jgi:hypothetical protein
MANIQVAPFTVGSVYQDDRFKEVYAFNVRHNDTTEILRFRDKDEAVMMRKSIVRQGYKPLRKTRVYSRV